MIKRFGLSLFRNTRTAPSFSFCSKQEPPKGQAKVEPTARKQQKYNEDDDAQPEFQKDDRSTTGWMIYRFFFWGYSSLLAYNIYLLHTHNKPTPVQEQTGAVSIAMYPAKFIYKNFNEMTEFMTKPPVEKLMPDIIHPLMHPKTLVLNVTGTLLDTQYVFGKGLVVKKRPGLQQFLKKMGGLYQIVLFSDDDSMLLETLIPSLDPRQQFIHGYFGHQCMVFSHGRYIKDLKYLNRDLKNVIVIDKSKQVVEKQKQNVIVLSNYKGDQQDRQLIHLSALLQNMAKPQVRDIRKQLQQMGEDPVAKYAAIMKQKQQQIKNNKSGKLFGFLSSKKN